MIELLLRVLDHLLVLCKFVITVLIIVDMSLNIAYHLLYVMHLKLDVVISEPKYIYLSRCESLTSASLSPSFPCLFQHR
jgi:hypothetical protein